MSNGTVLILGSGPNAPKASAWPRASFDRIVVINNAWRIRSDWDDLIYPYDFPDERMPARIRPEQRLIDQTHFVPAQNAYGGFLYAGATMAFTAGYWALHALAPRVIAFFGCDMHYAGTETHFYGVGTADPLRNDISLRSLEAKSARLMVYAARQRCAVVNLSTNPSRLVCPRAALADLSSAEPSEIVPTSAEKASEWEARLSYTTPNGFHAHWVETADLAALDAIDALWRDAISGS
ncbi:MAG: hypothetical protein AAF330_00055 [Pseudomonadota bacterium]